MRFDWTDLRIFLHVCEAGSMTGAATRCHLTLAAVSARILNLEETNGITLLRRLPRGVAPTPAGEILAAHARLVFDQIQRLEHDLAHGLGASERPWVVLANSSALARPLVEAVAAPNLPEERRATLVRESSSEATVQALRSGAADIGIVSDAVDTHGLIVRELGPDPLMLVVPRAHALAARASVRFHQAAAHPWVMWGERSALSTHLQMHALALGARLQAHFTYPALDGVLRLVGQGFGITVLPQAVVEGAPAAGAVACVQLDEGWARRRLLVCQAQGEEPSRRLMAERLVAWWSGR
ncbi:MAG TPA: LysR family transcriptional regulator [Ramlibacter sp.]|nr:LysR family transcriptional regulator [Ramlibacter sp.]